MELTVKWTGKELGNGAYGRVFEVDYEGTLCAAKEIHKSLLEHASDNDLRKLKRDFLAECGSWSKLRHPHIVQFLGKHHDPLSSRSELPIIVMEKMQFSLKELMERYGNVPMNVKASILYDVSLGLRYLHAKNIVHQELTPNNILLGQSLEAKISDMGVAKAIQTADAKAMTKIPGTPDFMPPKVF